jgi:hypothetical protein
MAVEVRTDMYLFAVVGVTKDIASLLTDAIADETFTVPGVLSTDYCVAVVPPVALEAGIVIQGARVTANNTVVVRVQNLSAGTVNAASGSWNFIIGR